MRVIVDSNRIISALIKEGVSRKILSSKNIEFFTVDYVMKEINKYKATILEKSGMSAEEVSTLFSLIMENINIIPEEDVKSKMKEALAIMKNIDTKDAPFIAAALAIPNDGIWSHDRHFEKQKKVKQWLAKNLLKYI
ncbi:hypothetical protein J4448_06215 [Candidatus Woesearchaeota archaeon]|nr:hypothetical protein [Candidatus Woesearchaeota archaeon]